MQAPVAEAEAALAPFTHYVGRQPILDTRRRVFGYELLFRSGLDNRFSGDSDEATRQVIDNALLFGLDNLASGALAFIDCTRESLIQRLVTSLPPTLTVLEVPELPELDGSLVEACADLKRAGYRIAVANLPSKSLLPLVDFLKVEVNACSAGDLARAQSSAIQRIAERVETEADFQRALADGFTCFQGFFFAHPTVLTRREIPPGQMLYVQLLSAITSDPYDEREVERLVMSEASVCFRLLRLVNSPTLAIRGKITSIRQALLLIGQDEFRKLVTVASATSFGKRFKMPSELILLALHRARFCELIAPIAQQAEGEQYLIGLLSAFDAILQIPTEQVVEMLPLREDAGGALLGRDTSVATPYQLLKAYEQRQWVRCARACHKLRISEAELTSMYIAALQWATKEIRDAGL